jgi:ubiquinone/menaquinone biosynthesis C-methylase UbiE
LRILGAKEKERILPIAPVLKEFWQDYLVGRDRSFGSELLASGSAYRQMMDIQASLFDLRSGGRFLDLGSGNGAFEIHLQRWPECPPSLFIYSIDFVEEALRRARARLLRERSNSCELNSFFTSANLNLRHSQQSIPMKSGCFDWALASFVLSYLEKPELVLREVYRLLRSGGRLVVSSMCRDADISLLYAESVTEFRLGVAGGDLVGIEDMELSIVAQNFLNDAARILQLEEVGIFRFWEAADFKDLLSNEGFSDVEVRTSLGSPPQALIVSGIRP